MGFIAEVSEGILGRVRQGPAARHPRGSGPFKHEPYHLGSATPSVLVALREAWGPGGLLRVPPATIMQGGAGDCPLAGRWRPHAVGSEEEKEDSLRRRRVSRTLPSKWQLDQISL